MASILEKFYFSFFLTPAVTQKCIGLMRLSRSNDRIPARLPPEASVAHKTGLERGVCHDVGVVFTRKGNFMICVLTKHANSNSRSSKDFIAKLALLTYNYFDNL